MRRAPAPDRIPVDPLDWRPQVALPTKRPGKVTNPILEPDWEGLRVLVHYDSEGGEGGEALLRIIDDEGEDATEDEPLVTEQLLRAVSAVDCILDGFLTDQATRSGEGTFQGTTTTSVSSRLFSQPRAEVDVPGPRGHDREGVVAFVAVDVLRLDGQTLLDVPLLERKRLLDSLLLVHDRVRVSPYTQPPLAPWLATWKSAGFRGAILKAANSRYVPSSETSEWTLVSALHVR